MIEWMAFLRRAEWLILLVCLLSSLPVGCQRRPALAEAQGLTPARVVDLYIRWIKTGQVEKAYALRTAEIQRDLDFASFKAFVEQGRQEKSSSWQMIISMKPLGETLASSTLADVEVEYQREGQPQVMTVTCRKEDDIWKLGAFR